MRTAVFVWTLAAVTAFSLSSAAQANTYTALATSDQVQQEPPVESSAVSLATFHFVRLFGAEFLVTVRYDWMFTNQVQGASIRMAGVVDDDPNGDPIGGGGGTPFDNTTTQFNNTTTQFNNTVTQFNNTNTQFNNNNTQFSNTTTQFGTSTTPTPDQDPTNGDPTNGDPTNGGDPNNNDDDPPDNDPPATAPDVALDFGAGAFAFGNLTISIHSAASLSGAMQGRTLADLQELFDAGQAFLVVSTSEFPNGEVRGQIQPLTASDFEQ